MCGKLWFPFLLIAATLHCGSSSVDVSLKPCLKGFISDQPTTPTAILAAPFRPYYQLQHEAFLDQPLWLKCSMEDLSGLEPESRYRMVLENGFIQMVDAYLFEIRPNDPPHLIHQFQAGSSLDRRGKGDQHRQPAFLLGELKKDYVFLIRLESQTRMRPNLSLLTEEAFNSRLREQGYIFTIFYGALGLLFVANLMGYAGLKKKHYLHINAFLAFLLIFHSFMDQFWPAGFGHGTEFFRILGATGPLAATAFAHFLQGFLKPYDPGPWLRNLVRILFYSGLAGAALYILSLEAGVTMILIILPAWLAITTWCGLLILRIPSQDVRFLGIALLLSLPLALPITLAELALDIDSLSFLPFSRLLLVPGLLLLTYSVTHALARSAREKQENLESAVRDRTRQLMTESLRSEEAGKIKDNILRILSHDIRSPLAALKTNIPLLKRQQLPAHTREELLQEMESTVDQLLQLSNWVLESSRAGSGKPGMEPRWTPIRAFLQEIVDRFKGTAASRGIHIRVTAPPWEFLIDPPLFSSMVSNLISNSTPHLEEGGHLDLIATLEDEFNLRIVDDGSGIPEGEQQWLFDPSRTGRNQGEGHRGHGLGLILSREIALLHGGDLQLEHSIPGHTVFRFRMPANRVFVPGETRSRGQSIVLLVDDDPAFRQMVRALFYQTDPQLSTIEASNTRQALRILREVQPGLIVTDLWMPGEDGFHLIQSLAGDERYLRIPVWAISADASSREKLKGYKNVKEFIEKPVRAEVLKRKFNDFVRENRQ